MRKTLSVLLSLLLVILTLPAQAHEGSHTVLEMMAKGDEYLANGDLSKSLMCYDISNKLEPDNVDVMLRFVAAYQLEGDNDAALEWASKAIYIDPASGDAYVARYLLLMELERYEEAWLDMQYAVICGAAVAEKQYADIAKALTSIGRYETAYDAFSNAGGVALSSDYADTYRTCLVRTGNREKALSLGLIKTRPIEKAKNHCAKKLFSTFSTGLFTYDHVDSFQELMNKVMA